MSEKNGLKHNRKWLSLLITASVEDPWLSAATCWPDVEPPSRNAPVFIQFKAGGRTDETHLDGFQAMDQTGAAELPERSILTFSSPFLLRMLTTPFIIPRARYCPSLVHLRPNASIRSRASCNVDDGRPPPPPFSLTRNMLSCCSLCVCSPTFAPATKGLQREMRTLTLAKTSFGKPRPAAT